MDENNKNVNENLGYEEEELHTTLGDEKSSDEGEHNYSLDLDKLGLNTPKDEKPIIIEERAPVHDDEAFAKSLETSLDKMFGDSISPENTKEDKEIADKLDTALDDHATFSSLAKEISPDEIHVEDYSEGLNNKGDDITLDPSRLFSQIGEPSFELHPEMWKTSSEFEEEEVKPRSR